MSIFSKIKEAKSATDEEQEEKNKPSSKKPSKLMKKLGVKIEKAPTQDDEKVLKRQAEEREVWNYIRHQIDIGSVQYLENQDTRILKEYVRGAAYQAIISKLDELRAQGVYIEINPNSIAERRDNRFEIIGERLNPNGQPNQFTLRERFSDKTVFKTEDGRSTSAGGAERLIQATVDVEGDSYQLVSVIKIHGDN